MYKKTSLCLLNVTLITFIQAGQTNDVTNMHLKRCTRTAHPKLSKRGKMINKAKKKKRMHIKQKRTLDKKKKKRQENAK
jgi:hypothetical protein